MGYRDLKTIQSFLLRSGWVGGGESGKEDFQRVYTLYTHTHTHTESPGEKQYPQNESMI